MQSSTKFYSLLPLSSWGSSACIHSSSRTSCLAPFSQTDVSEYWTICEILLAPLVQWTCNQHCYEFH